MGKSCSRSGPRAVGRAYSLSASRGSGCHSSPKASKIYFRFPCYRRSFLKGASLAVLTAIGDTAHKVLVSQPFARQEATQLRLYILIALMFSCSLAAQTG